MYIVMLGAQGTGKGTVAGLISEKTNWPQISTGDIFRENINKNTLLGIEANKYISKGKLVPDEITIPMITERLNNDDAKNGFILDGFPRTIDQAKKLDEILAKNDKKLDLVINLVAPRDEIIQRILTRRVCSNQACKKTYNIVMLPPKTPGICDKCGSKLVQRDDDSSEDAIKRRLSIYDEQTSPLVDYYNEKGILRTEQVSVKINHLGIDVAHEILQEIEGSN